jgi:hypothetical protein
MGTIADRARSGVEDDEGVAEVGGGAEDSGAEPAGSMGSADDPQSVLICDEDGGELTTASIRLDGGARLIVLADVHRPDALMAYLFLAGAYRVSVALAGARVEGRLDTRWHNGARTWMVKLASPLAERGDSVADRAVTHPRGLALSPAAGHARRR